MHTPRSRHIVWILAAALTAGTALVADGGLELREALRAATGLVRASAPAPEPVVVTIGARA